MDNKIITIPEVSKTNVDKKERIVLKKEKWEFDEEYFLSEKQLDILINKNNDIIYNKMMQEIQKKINGYKQQDKDKKKINNELFVDIDYIVDLLKQCEIKCFYCKCNTTILYKKVREPKQWSLERIDNDYGHNKDNVAIACLECNLRRKTMYHERYLFTKQLNIIKK